MPANLTPQFLKAERDLRRARSLAERVAALERMLTLVPRHKGTERLQASIKTRLKQARAARQAQYEQRQAGPAWRIPRQGAGQVVILGGPNSGKSRILKELTSAEASVADYPFATREPMLGMLRWNEVAIQLIDTPPVTGTHFESHLTNLVRVADLVLLAFNGSDDGAASDTSDVVEQFAARSTRLANQTGFDESDYSILDVKTLLVVTRGDSEDAETRVELFYDTATTAIPFVKIDFQADDAREQLSRAVYDALDIIRIFTKRPGHEVEMANPFVVPNGSTVLELAECVHDDLAAGLRSARLWRGAEENMVGREFILQDGDVVELHSDGLR